MTVEMEESSRPDSLEIVRGEINMLTSMLRWAFIDLYEGGHREQEARNWIWEEDQAREWSFDWVCENLNIDPDIMKEHALRLIDSRPGEKKVVEHDWRNKRRFWRTRD